MSAIEPLTAGQALDPRSRFLPDVDANGYAIGGAETLAAAMHRVTTAQFTVAIDALTTPGPDAAVTTHTTLDAIDRISAILRLVRSVIGDAAYRTELHVLRETADRLTTVLDGHPEVVALDRILARYASVLRPEALHELRSNLVQRHQLRRLHALSEDNILEHTLHSLRRARARFAAWPIEGDTARMYGREPIPDAFSSVAPGLRQTYKRARKHWTAGRDALTDDTVADWQRETRRLGHQLELLATCWPTVVGATADACGQLDEVLSEASAYRTLRAVVAADPSLCPDPTERSLLAALVRGTDDELAIVAATLGARLYVEPTDMFADRLDAYWSARNLLR